MMSQQPESITLTGTTYKVGDTLENYEQAAKLMDACVSTIYDAPGFRWWTGVNYRALNLPFFPEYNHFPIKITALPSQPKPEPVEDWFEYTHSIGCYVWFLNPCKDEIDCALNTHDEGTYSFLTALATNGVKFYATEADCKQAEGIE